MRFASPSRAATWKPDVPLHPSPSARSESPALCGHGDPGRATAHAPAVGHPGPVALGWAAHRGLSLDRAAAARPLRREPGVRVRACGRLRACARACVRARARAWRVLYVRARASRVSARVYFFPPAHLQCACACACARAYAHALHGAPHFAASHGARRGRQTARPLPLSSVRRLRLGHRLRRRGRQTVSSCRPAAGLYGPTRPKANSGDRQNRGTFFGNVASRTERFVGLMFGNPSHWHWSLFDMSDRGCYHFTIQCLVAQNQQECGASPL